MPSNHLIIGLGGTGGKILRAFRKQIFQNFRAEDPTGVNVRYLYVDSSDEMMGHDDPTWKILGSTVQLKKTSQLLITGLNLSQVLDNVGSYPGISPWIGSKDQFRNILSSANAANIVGGQKRRLGRFLFACMSHKFREQTQALVREMELGGTAAVTFHVTCGLAGGTGSGSVVDAVAQIRMMYPGKNYRILIYAFLPDRNPAPNRAGANYHANGYAALAELNAISTGAYQVFDVTGTRQGRQELQDPFNCCYLFTDENEDHNRVDIDKELPEMVASYLYEKVVTNERVSWNALRRMETFENMDFRPEESPSGRKPERSRLFFAFGVKQIAYPEEEIREYMTYAFARQAALQLMFNRWSDDFGYTEEPVNQSFNEYVRLKETQERWHITDEKLQLSEGILPDEMKNKRWKPITQFWMDLIPNFKSHVRESHGKNEAVWLDELGKLCETAYSQNYRDLGVKKFYETKRGEQKDHIRELRRRIELDLFQEWSTGVKSMFDLSRLMAALITSLEERLAAIDDKAAKMKDNEAQVAAKVSANVKEWAKLGPLSRALGKGNSIFDAQGEVLTQLYMLRTRVEALDFQKRLMQALIAEIGTLAAEISRANSMITEALKAFTDSVEERCADTGAADLQKQVIRFYNPTQVKDFTKALCRDKTEQQKQTNAVRAELAKLLGETPSFGAFNSRIGKQKFIGVLELTCERMAIEAHNNHVAGNPDRSRILGVSVIERLQKEYGGNPDSLRGYLIGVVSRAKNFLCFNEAEVKRQGPGVTGGGFVSYLSVILPEAKELAEFRAKLQDEIVNATPGAKEVVPSTDRPNTITMIALTNLFPARFVADVGFLHEKYRGRVDGPESAQARMELHGEGDGSNLPNIFIEDVNPVKYRGYLMLAQAMGVVAQLEDPDTGISSLYLMPRDNKGRELDPVMLGKDMEAALADASLITYDAVTSTVSPLLETDFLHRSKRQELVKAVNDQVAEIRAIKKNPLDKVYKAYVQSANYVETLVAPKQ
jgi:hypothetical protein